MAGQIAGSQRHTEQPNVMQHITHVVFALLERADGTVAHSRQILLTCEPPQSCDHVLLLRSVAELSRYSSLPLHCFDLPTILRTCTGS